MGLHTKELKKSVTNLLQTSREVADLFFVGVFALEGLLFRDFQGFEVVTDDTQLFFEFDDFAIENDIQNDI